MTATERVSEQGIAKLLEESGGHIIMGTGRESLNAAEHAAIIPTRTNLGLITKAASKLAVTGTGRAIEESGVHLADRAVEETGQKLIQKEAEELAEKDLEKFTMKEAEENVSKDVESGAEQGYLNSVKKGVRKMGKVLSSKPAMIGIEAAVLGGGMAHEMAGGHFFDPEFCNVEAGVKKYGIDFDNDPGSDTYCGKAKPIDGMDDPVADKHQGSGSNGFGVPNGHTPLPNGAGETTTTRTSAHTTPHQTVAHNTYAQYQQELAARQRPTAPELFGGAPDEPVHAHQNDMSNAYLLGALALGGILVASNA